MLSDNIDNIDNIDYIDNDRHLWIYKYGNNDSKWL